MLMLSSFYLPLVNAQTRSADEFKCVMTIGLQFKSDKENGLQFPPEQFSQKDLSFIQKIIQGINKTWEQIFSKYGKDTPIRSILARNDLTPDERLVLAYPDLGSTSHPVWSAYANEGRDSCIRLNQLNIASMIKTTNQGSKDLEDLNNMFKKFEREIKSNPLYQNCPQYKSAKLACSTAGSYERCMDIRLGFLYKEVGSTLEWMCN